MRKYTMADFANFEKDKNGVILCPPGDYTAIQEFGDKCLFSGHCRFGEESHFGWYCSFGEMCGFAERCTFAKGCNFGKWCSFGRWCYFVGNCLFGERCHFAASCSFGKWCRFAAECEFGEDCTCESKYKFIDLFQIGYIGSRKDTTQFWLLADKTILVRCGCYCGHIDEFVARVEQTHGENHYAKEYLAAVALTKLHFEEEDKETDDEE